MCTASASARRRSRRGWRWRCRGGGGGARGAFIPMLPPSARISAWCRRTSKRVMTAWCCLCCSPTHPWQQPQARATGQPRSLPPTCSVVGRKEKGNECNTVNYGKRRGEARKRKEERVPGEIEACVVALHHAPTPGNPRNAPGAEKCPNVLQRAVKKVGGACTYQGADCRVGETTECFVRALWCVVRALHGFCLSKATLCLGLPCRRPGPASSRHGASPLFTLCRDRDRPREGRCKYVCACVCVRGLLGKSRLVRSPWHPHPSTQRHQHDTTGPSPTTRADRKNSPPSCLLGLPTPSTASLSAP